MASPRNHRIIPQPDGNIYEVYNEALRHESAFSHSALPSNPAGIDYPLIVIFSGSGIWEQGACFRRRRCTTFAVELVTAGSTRFVVDGKEYQVQPGMVFVQRPGTINEQSVGDAGFFHKRFIEISGPGRDAMLEHLFIGECDVCRIAQPPRMARLMREAARLMRDKPDGHLFALSVLAYEVLLMLSENFVPQRYPPALCAVLLFLDRNIHRTVSIKELASIAGLSPSQLHRTFKRHLHDTPLVFFEKTKMHAAAHRLRSSFVPIGEIAREFGFGDPAYFSNLFRKVMGVSPSGYRKGKKE